MKLIFLDIDGVMVTHATWGQRRDHGHANADPTCIAVLNHIIAQTGADIVVTSVWRLDRNLAELREIINLHFGITGRVVDRTPRLIKKQDGIYVAQERGEEIAAWLNDYERYPIESFVILDDDADMGALKDRLVQTSFERGLTMADAERAIELLRTSVEITA